MQQESTFNGKFWIAMVLAIAILIVWDFVFLKDQREAEIEAKKRSVASPSQDVIVKNTNQDIQAQSLSRNDAFVATNRIMISNDVISGSLSVNDGVIDDISLLKYKESTSENSSNIRLFDLQKTQNAYFFKSGYVLNNKYYTQDNGLVYKSKSSKLTPNNPILLETGVIDGVIFRKYISIDNQYLITVVDEVESVSSSNKELSGFASIIRHNDPNVEDLFISHEGFVGDINNTLERVDYGDVLSKPYSYQSNGGFLGFTDKYWLSAIVLQGGLNQDASFSSFKDNLNINNYKINANTRTISIGGNNKYQITTKVFVGPKEYNVINKYAEQFNLSKFDDTIDFGWFFFFTKPMIQFLLWIHSLVGSFGLAILIFTVVIRLIILPVAYKSYVSMAKMKELQPKMKELKENYKNDLTRYNKELMDLYRKEQVNPLSGCLPILLQIPIFFSIYKVIFISIEMRHAPFWGWIKDLSFMDTTNIFNIFGLIPWSPPELLHIGVWPILMGLSMYVQQKLNTSQAMDPMQQKIMNLMPVFLTVVLARFPVGLVIYWTWSNVLSIFQQYFINKKVHNDLLKRKK